MMNMPFTNFAAANYNCGAYGAGEFGQAECAQQQGQPSTTDGNTSGSLADTGYDVIIPLALGAALILAAVILFIKKVARRNRKS